MHPTNLKKIFCRLCLNSIRDANYQIIRENIKHALGIVFPTLNLEENDKHFICKVCYEKLFAAFNFKSICMDTEDIIFLHINASKVSVADLKEVYIKEKGYIQLTDVGENQRICRLCFQFVTYGSVSLNEVNVDILDIYIPQL
ncbi:uncharacterized protein LOC108915649, partial [Anoplophora glabripennis]|uniref:uncharacterized protein LOC108915649 n=1 Tax=Anoplophora glabripennis TaxID=217634 RepID=UPI000874D14D